MQAVGAGLLQLCAWLWSCTDESYFRGCSIGSVGANALQNDAWQQCCCRSDGEAAHPGKCTRQPACQGASSSSPAGAHAGEGVGSGRRPPLQPRGQRWRGREHASLSPQSSRSQVSLAHFSNKQTLSTLSLNHADAGSRHSIAYLMLPLARFVSPHIGYNGMQRCHVHSPAGRRCQRHLGR